MVTYHLGKGYYLKTVGEYENMQNGGNGLIPAFPLNHNRADISREFSNIFSKNENLMTKFSPEKNCMKKFLSNPKLHKI